MSPLSIQESFTGKHILLTGASGFLGKVWLIMALTRIPEIGRIYILMRGKGRNATERFEKIVSESMAFAPMHEQHGPRMSQYISERVEVVVGDVSLPGLGLDPEVSGRLRRSLDLVVNCAGLVEFNPDIREALGSNVDGALHVLEFVRRTHHAALMHVSTCYVAGQRDGFITEEVREGRSPNGTKLDAEGEYQRVKDIIDDVAAENATPATEQQLRADVIERLRERGHEADPSRVNEMVGRLKGKRLRQRMAEAGTERAKALGWPNTYTYSKALAELMLRARAGDVALTLFRPAIVESAMSFPFAGWNEGFNTSGPLVYLAGTWFRHVPAKEGNPLDIVPVDFVCNAMFGVGAALMRGVHEPVYHCGTSHRNGLSVDRLTELSALGHRKHLRKHGTTKVDKLVLSRWDARATEPNHVLDVTNIREVVVQVRRYLRHGLPEKIPSEVREWADELVDAADQAQRKLRQVEDMLELFMPFTHDHYIVFEGRALKRLDIVEPEFRFEPEKMVWRKYWLDVHLPGLRRWCFPTYENKELQKYSPATPFRMRRLEPSHFASTSGLPAGAEAGARIS